MVHVLTDLLNSALMECAQDRSVKMGGGVPIRDLRQRAEVKGFCHHAPGLEDHGAPQDNPGGIVRTRHQDDTLVHGAQTFDLRSWYVHAWEDHMISDIQRKALYILRHTYSSKCDPIAPCTKIPFTRPFTIIL